MADFSNTPKSINRRGAFGGVIGTIAALSSASALQAKDTPEARVAFHLRALQEAMQEIDPSIGEFYVQDFEANRHSKHAVQITAYRTLGVFSGDGLYKMRSNVEGEGFVALVEKVPCGSRGFWYRVTELKHGQDLVSHYEPFLLKAEIGNRLS